MIRTSLRKRRLSGMIEHARHHQLPIGVNMPDVKDSGLGVHTENIIDEMGKAGDMTALAESVIVWRAQYIAWNADILEAEKILSRLVFKEGSRNPQAMDLLARVYFQRGKYEEARGLWDRALTLQPGNPALRGTAEEMRRIAESPGPTVVRHRISVFLNYLLASLVICIVGLAIPRVYDWLMKRVNDIPAAAVENPGERFFDRYYQKFAPTFKDDVSSRFDCFIPYPFSAADAGERVLYRAGADSAEGGETRIIGFARKKAVGGREIGRVDVAVERVGGTLRASGKIPSLYVRYLVEEALWKTPGITDMDPRGLVVDRKYRVNSGDSLWLIAKKIYGQGSSWTLLAKANNLRDSSKLRVGQVLVLPLGDEILLEDAE
jgi:LysM repeat protein